MTSYDGHCVIWRHMTSYDVIWRHMTSYDGKLRYLPHQGVSTVHSHLVNPDRVKPDIPDFSKNSSAQAPLKYLIMHKKFDNPDDFPKIVRF